jgi:hypothetical protein
MSQSLLGEKRRQTGLKLSMGTVHTYVLSETQGLTDVWVWRCRLWRQSARPYVSCRVVCARPELCAVQRLTRPLLSAPIVDESASRSWPAPRAPWQTTTRLTDVAQMARAQEET